MPSRAGALLLALAAACGRPPETEPAAPPSLPAPERSVPAALGPRSADFSNDAQIRGLRDEAEDMGIESVGEAARTAREPVGYDEGLARTRLLSADFAAQRRALDAGRPREVVLPGRTPTSLKSEPPDGAPLEK